MTIKEMDEQFQITVVSDDTDGGYKNFKSANSRYVFYDDLTEEEKNFAELRGMSFDLIGRICLNDELIRKDVFYKMVE
jgi:hypothetical protein